MRRRSSPSVTTHSGRRTAWRLAIALCLLLAIALPGAVLALAASPDLRGTWNGTVTFSGDGSVEPVVLDITAPRKSKWTGMFSMFDGDVTALVDGKVSGQGKVSAKFRGEVGQFRVTKGSMKGEAAPDGLSANGTFNVTVDGKGTFTGTWVGNR